MYQSSSLNLAAIFTIPSVSWILGIAFLVIGLTSGCGGGKTSDSGGNGGTGTGILGIVQKGPFIIGSTIAIQELDAQLVPIGSNFIIQTSDNLGSFNLPAGINSQFIEIIVQGFYFDEIGNSLSAAPITLRTISDISSGTSVKINLLTSLSTGRVRNLVSGGATFEAARTQTQSEILAIFGIPGLPALNFDQMDISQSGNANAILLAVSAIILQMAHNRNPSAIDAELSSLIATISTDLESDGVLNSPTLEDDLLTASMTLNLAELRMNLEAHYANLGTSITGPAFEDYVDSDGDGILNKDDPSLWVSLAPLPTGRANLGVAFAVGSLFAIGGETGQSPYMSIDKYDVPSDSWSTVIDLSESAHDFPAVVVNGKVLLVGGSRGGIVSGLVEEYDPVSNTFTNCGTAAPGNNCASMPVGFSGTRAGAALANGKVYVFGCCNGTTSVIEYDPTNNSWATDKAPMPAARFYHRAESVGGIVYLMGGYDRNLVLRQATVFAYDPGNDSWTTKKSMSYPRANFASAVVNGKIYVMGGTDSSVLIEYSEIYDPVTDIWSPAEHLTSKRGALAAASDGQSIYVMGGSVGILPYLDTVERFTPLQ